MELVNPSIVEPSAFESARKALFLSLSNHFHSKQCEKKHLCLRCGKKCRENTLYLEKFWKLHPMSEQGKFGETYILKIAKLGNVDVAIKLTPIGNINDKREEQLVKRFTKLAMTANLPHFPLLYTYGTCNSCIYTSKHLLKRRSPPKCRLMLVEAANGGDLGIWAEKKRDPHVWASVIMQCFISIYLFQSTTGMVHTDTHTKNFLITERKPGGQMNYKIGDVNYHVPNHGSYVFLWDYGEARKAKKHQFFLDYIRILEPWHGILSIDSLPRRVKEAVCAVYDTLIETKVRSWMDDLDESELELRDARDAFFYKSTPLSAFEFVCSEFLKFWDLKKTKDGYVPK